MILSNEVVNRYIDEAKMFKNRLLNIEEEVDITRPLTPNSKNSLINEDVKNLNLNLLNLYQYIYLHNNILEYGIKPIVKNNELQNTNAFLSFKQEVSKIEHDLFKARLKNKYPTSNIYITNDFQDSNSKSKSLLTDPKTNISFNSLEICNGSKQTLTLNERINYRIKPKETYIKYNECNCFIWEIDDLNNLSDETKNFRCIVRKKRSNVLSNKDIENSSALLTIVFDFKTVRKINSLRINENCISKMILEKDDIQFLEKNRYKSISNSSDYVDGELIFFNTIETSRIKITFKQLAFLDISQDIKTNSLPVDLYSDKESTDDYFYYYDMSLSEVEFNYSIYKPQSLYRSNYIYGFKKPQSISFEETYSFYDNTSFVEKYVYLILYGDKESSFLNEKGISVRDFSRSKPSFEGLLPITNEYRYKELALPTFFNGIDAYCKLTFVPVISSILLNFQNVSIFTRDMNPVEQISNYEAGSYFVKISNYSYSQEYILEYNINTNEKTTIFNDFVFENGSISIPEKFSNSIGFIQPVIILRNKSMYNDSTCVIKSYGLIVEEKESLENNVLNYDIFLAENRGL